MHRLDHVITQMYKCIYTKPLYHHAYIYIYIHINSNGRSNRFWQANRLYNVIIHHRWFFELCNIHELVQFQIIDTNHTIK